MAGESNRRKFLLALRAVTGVLLMLALFFIPAGTFRWPEAWLFILFYLASVSGVFIWLKKRSPSLLKERMAGKKGSKRWDRTLMMVYSFFLIALLVVPGLDAVRFRWSKVPLALKGIGFLGLFPGLVFAFWAMRENAFASNVVRIQKERGHTVCTTGPYRYIRHPMYAGVILVMLFFPLSLGSLYAYIPASVIIILFIIRASLEDKELQQELPGYKEYSRSVRYRLLPGVW